MEKTQTHDHQLMKAESVLDEDQTQLEDYADVSLRLLDPSDADDFLAWATDEKVCEYFQWDPNRHPTKESAMSYIATRVVPHPWFRAICVKNRPVGELKVTPNQGNDRCRAEIGYVLGSKYWGKGIATRAVKLAVSTIFIDLPELERLEALVDVDNFASQRVLEKVGFEKEGVMRKYFLHHGKAIDMVMFSLLPSDPPVVDLMFG